MEKVIGHLQMVEGPRQKVYSVSVIKRIGGTSNHKLAQVREVE